MGEMIPVNLGVAQSVRFAAWAGGAIVPKSPEKCMRRTALPLVALGSALLGVAPASAQPSLAGKAVRVVVGSAVSGTYDLLGRLVARHIGRHLPGNPQVVPQNMPGGGGLVAANYLFNVAPKDGTTIAIFNKGVAGAAIAGVPEARFDATRMTW